MEDKKEEKQKSKEKEERERKGRKHANKIYHQKREVGGSTTKKGEGQGQGRTRKQDGGGLMYIITKERKTRK